MVYGVGAPGRSRTTNHTEIEKHFQRNPPTRLVSCLAGHKGVVKMMISRVPCVNSNWKKQLFYKGLPILLHAQVHELHSRAHEANAQPLQAFNFLASNIY